VNDLGLEEADDRCNALSYESPRLPIDGAMCASARRSVYRMDTYCVPRSP
jgi:hypothetical protein